jgi:hypothetical protein
LRRPSSNTGGCVDVKVKSVGEFSQRRVFVPAPIDPYFVAYKLSSFSPNDVAAKERQLILDGGFVMGAAFS